MKKKNKIIVVRFQMKPEAKTRMGRLRGCGWCGHIFPQG